VVLISRNVVIQQRQQYGRKIWGCSGIAQARLLCGTLRSMLWSFAQSRRQWISKLCRQSDYIFWSSSEHTRILQCVKTSSENLVSVTADSDSEISKSDAVVCTCWCCKRLGYDKIFECSCRLHKQLISTKLQIRGCSRLKAWWTRWWDLSTALNMDLNDFTDTFATSKAHKAVF